jgi:antirestriction protein ArdC
MPNPCAFPDSDAYAHLLCHELGHANGWPPTHGDFGESEAAAPSANATSGKKPT